MALTEKQIHLAHIIDTHVEHILTNGGGDEDLLVSMADHMGTFKQFASEVDDEVNAAGIHAAA